MSHDGFTSAPDPPVNEVPAQMSTRIAWRNPGASLSIPEVFLYTTGIEIALLYRTKDVEPAVTPETVTAGFQSMRTWRKRLGQLKVNGAATDVRTLQLHERGFTARAWSAFVSHQVDRPENAIRFELNWPEFESAVYTMPYASRDQKEQRPPGGIVPMGGQEA